MQAETNSEVRDTLLLAGGVALMALGAGLIVANPAVRQVLLKTLAPLLPELQGPLTKSITGVLPDIERVMRIKAM
jgi:hypothetical protein